MDISRHQVVPWQTTPLDIKDLSRQAVHAILFSRRWF